RDLPHEVSEANQGGGPVLHQLQRVRASSSGRERRGARIPDRTEVGHHLSFRGTATARQGILRDSWLGLVWWGRHSQGGGIHRRRPALERRRDSRHGLSHGAYQIYFELDLGWS